MPKEPYIKPEIKSEEVVLGALADLPDWPVVSGGTLGHYFGIETPLGGFCCDI